MDLKEKKCEPCHAGAPKSGVEEVRAYMKELPSWELDENSEVWKISKAYQFKCYAESLDFVNKVGDDAEEEGHHPVMLFEFRQVTVTWWTHEIGGLHPNDFIMAAKCDAIYKKMGIETN